MPHLFEGCEDDSVPQPVMLSDLKTACDDTLERKESAGSLPTVHI